MRAMMPDASAHAATIPAFTASSVTAMPSPARPSTSPGPARTPSRSTSPARRPSIVRYARTSRPGACASRAKTVIPLRSRGPPAVRAFTAMTSAAGALNTTLFVPVSRKPSLPSGSARVSTLASS